MSINDLGAVHGRCDSTTVPASTLAYMRDLLVHLAPSSMAFIQPQYAHLRRFFAACSNDCASTTAWQNGLVAMTNQKIREQNYHPAAINTVRLNSPGVYRACQITEMRCPNWEGTTIGFCAPLASQRRDIVPTDEFATEVAESSLSNNPTEISKDAEPWTNQGTMFPPEVAKCPPQRSAGADYDEQVDMGKRYRTSYSPKQIELLEKTYQAERYISRPQRNKLAQELKLPENTIKVWFQNRRMKEKRQALMLPTVAGNDPYLRETLLRVTELYYATRYSTNAVSDLQTVSPKPASTLRDQRPSGLPSLPTLSSPSGSRFDETPPENSKCHSTQKQKTNDTTRAYKSAGIQMRIPLESHGYSGIVTSNRTGLGLHCKRPIEEQLVIPKPFDTSNGCEFTVPSQTTVNFSQPSAYPVRKLAHR